MMRCPNQKHESHRKRAYILLVSLLLLVAALEQTVELVVPMESLQPVEYYISNLLVTGGEADEEAQTQSSTPARIQNVFVPFQKWREQKFREIVSRLEHAEGNVALEEETKLSASEMEILVSLQKSMEQRFQDIEARASRNEAKAALGLETQIKPATHALFVPLQQWKEQKLRDIEAIVKHEKATKFLHASVSRT